MQVDLLLSPSMRVDWIKAALTGNGSSAQEPRLDVGVLTAIVDEAHREGAHVAVHTEGPADVADALSAGLATGDTIEHAASEPLDASLAAKAATSGVTFVPTLVLSSVTSLPLPQDALNAYFQAMRSAGVPVVAGTDSACASSDCRLRSIYPGWPVVGASLLDELGRMVTAGMPPTDALEAATRNASALLGLSDAGTIEAGRRADLLLVQGDPTSRIGDLSNLVVLVQAGHVVVDHRADH
jgi:imidazolonepropionase-like amidohydrolase